MLAAAIRAEQIRTLYRQSGPVVLANVLNTSIITATLWSSGPRRLLVGWSVLVLLTSGARLELRRRFWKAKPGSGDSRRWGLYFSLGSLCAGLLWGLAGYLLFDRNNTLAQLLVTFAIGGMGAGAAGTLSCYMPAFVAFMVPSVVPLAARMAMLGDGPYLAVATMVMVFGLALTFVARNVNRTISEALRLRFENDGLLARLSSAQLTLEETNRTLEQRVAERTVDLERQGEVLRHSQRLESLGRLAGGIAHDFNNLLTVVIGNVSLLRSDRTLHGETRTALEEVHAAADRAGDLVKQLLAFSRRQKLAPRVFDLNDVVRDLERLARRLVGEHIELRVELAAGPLLVLADASQIEQVVMNLVANARDAMAQGGRLTVTTARVQVAETTHGLPSGPYVLLSVADTGVGMDDQTRRRAFDPFFTTKPIGQGTGLGLATVYGIVEQTGGRIFLESASGQGTRFDIYFAQATEPAQTRGDAAPPAALAARTATILLAEDDADVRSVTARVLRADGHTVLVADSGKQALVLARQYPEPIDLLITDVVMPGLRGPALADLLRAERPALPVLFISGYSHDSEVPASTLAAPVDLLDKPFTPESLSRTVCALLVRAARTEPQ